LTEKPLTENPQQYNTYQSSTKELSTKELKEFGEKEFPPSQNQKTSKFKKPTIKEITEYCLSRKNGIDAEYFWNFYEARDWYVGKNKMKSWKSCIITWEKRNTSNIKSSKEEFKRVEPIPEWVSKVNEHQQPDDVHCCECDEDAATIERINKLRDEMKTQFRGVMK